MARNWYFRSFGLAFLLFHTYHLFYLRFVSHIIGAFSHMRVPQKCGFMTNSCVYYVPRCPNSLSVHKRSSYFSRSKGNFTAGRFRWPGRYVKWPRPLFLWSTVHINSVLRRQQIVARWRRVVASIPPPPLNVLIIMVSNQVEMNSS